ncbi:FHA domain-containing protein [Stackebrandtia soli]|uniref:FHA domain-containing protein n=1 Tax=Stackebrandtia soli TaxID=1892856 RepID=UPI0039E974AA
MTVCPNQHPVPTAQEYCDECGSRVATAAVSAPDAWTCAQGDCGTYQSLSRFCEACGHPNPSHPDYDGPEPEPSTASARTEPTTAKPSSWTLHATADRAYFDRMLSGEGPDAHGLAFPVVYPTRQFTIATQSVVGRRSVSRGVDPDIDLSAAPEDPGVSHVHAVFVPHENGALSVIDMGSANGTYLNESDEPLPANTPTPLSNGDTVHVGAWTRLRIEAVG